MIVDIGYQDIEDDSAMKCMGIGFRLRTVLSEGIDEFGVADALPVSPINQRLRTFI